jgi:hypothetical protein
MSHALPPIRPHIQKFSLLLFSILCQYKTYMDKNMLPSYQPLEESQVNENVFCWKNGSLIQIDGTKLVLVPICAALLGHLLTGLLAGLDRYPS